MKTKKIHTILKYAGNKSKIMEQIVPYFPDWKNVKRYIEPFAGALGSAANANIPSSIDIQLSDSNEELINLYMTLKTSAKEVEDQIAKWERNEKKFYEIRSWDRDPSLIPQKSNIERAARTVYLNRNCFNGLMRINKKGYFTAPWGHVESDKKIDIVGNVEFLDLVNRSTFTHQDWRDAIKGATKGDLIYCDPPYVDLKNPEADFAGYLGKFGLSEQIDLKDELSTAFANGASVFISNSFCMETINMYKNFLTYDIIAKRSLSGKASGRGEVQEILAVLVNTDHYTLDTI